MGKKKASGDQNLSREEGGMRFQSYLHRLFKYCVYLQLGFVHVSVALDEPGSPR